MPLNFDFDEQDKGKRLNFDFLDESTPIAEDNLKGASQVGSILMQRLAEAQAADPNNWTAEQTIQHFKKNPARTPEEETQRESFLTQKKEQEKEIKKQSAMQMIGEQFKQVMGDIPAQLQDFITMPSRLLNLPHPPMVSKLATQSIPAIAQTLIQKATTPIGEFTVPTLSKENIEHNVKRVLKGEAPDIMHETNTISPTPLDIALVGALGASGIRDVIMRTQWNAHLNKAITTEQIKGAVMENMPALENLTKQAGIELPADLPLEDKANVILSLGEKNPTFGVVITDLAHGRIAPRITPSAEVIDVGTATPVAIPEVAAKPVREMTLPEVNQAIMVAKKEIGQVIEPAIAQGMPKMQAMRLQMQAPMAARLKAFQERRADLQAEAALQPAAGGMIHGYPERLKKEGITVTGREAPIRITEDMKVKDIYGEEVVLPKSEEYTPFKLSNNQILLHDGKNIVVDQSQLKNVQGQNVILSEGKFIPGPEVQDPVQKVISALKSAKSVRGQQETLYSKARAQKFAKMQAVGEKIQGEKGFYAELGSLRGALPKADFEAIRNQLSQEDIDSLFIKVKDSPALTEWEKITARQGLAKLFGEYAGTVPTRNEISLLNQIFPKEFTQTLLDKRPLIVKMKDLGLELANAPRSLMASFDVSAPFRQGAFFVGRPKQFVPAFKEMFKYLGSEKEYNALQESFTAHPNYKLAKESKLSLTGTGPILEEREERFMSNLTERIPGIGIGVRASNRAYTGFLNKLRFDVFNDLVDKAELQGLDPKNDKDISTAIAQFVNNATGRGSIKGFEDAAVALNGFFFSPRLMMSRLNLLNPVYYVRQEPFVRKEALKSLFSFLGFGLTLIGLAKLAGAKVKTDPRSSDFGKIRIGNTRIDPWAGFQQYVRMAAQITTGKYVSSYTGKVMTLGEGYKPLTRFDILQRQLESKEAPVASFFTTLLRGQTFTGEKASIPKEIGQRFIPMAIQDAIDLAKENPALIPLGLLGMTGFGLQTYESQGKDFVLSPTKREEAEFIIGKKPKKNYKLKF